MKNAFMRNSMAAGILAVMAIGGVFVAARADDASKPNQQTKGKAGDMGSSTTMPAGGPLFDPASEFHRAFKSAATATERRGLVMKACDDGLIHRYMTLEDLKKLFGDSPMFTLFPADKATGKQSAVLEFFPPEPPPPMPAGYDAQIVQHERAWYMRLFLEQNRVDVYYLTNVGK